MGIQLGRNRGCGRGGGGGHHMLCSVRYSPVPLGFLFQVITSLTPHPTAVVLGTISQKGGEHVKVGSLVESGQTVPLGFHVKIFVQKNGQVF